MALSRILLGLLTNENSGLSSSIRAAYTKEEISAIVSRTQLKNAIVSENMIGIIIKGVK
jgi:hypothetical protein